MKPPFSLKTEVAKPDELQDKLKSWLDELRSGDLILLKGPMGGGKTTLVASLVQYFGSPQAASPTYALHHRYQCQKFIVDHWDLYRLTDLDQLESTGFWDLLQDDAVVIVEWPEKVPTKFWPEERRIFRVEIEVLKSGSRGISVVG